MSEPQTCSSCGQVYGASWGDVSGLCPACSRGETPQKLREQNKELKQQVRELEEELVAHQPLSFLGQDI